MCSFKNSLPALTSVEIGARGRRRTRRGRQRRRGLLQRVLRHVPQADVRVLAHRAEPVAGHVLLQGLRSFAWIDCLTNFDKSL